MEALCTSVRIPIADSLLQRLRPPASCSPQASGLRICRGSSDDPVGPFKHQTLAAIMPAKRASRSRAGSASKVRSRTPKKSSPWSQGVRRPETDESDSDVASSHGSGDEQPEPSRRTSTRSSKAEVTRDRIVPAWIIFIMLPIAC